MPTTMLVCKQCNFENEPERVYCHNCGTKLDRSLLPPEATKREDPVVVQERVRRMVKPRNISLQQNLKNLVYSVLLSAVLAAIVVIIKPPGDQPNLSQDAVLEAPAITDDLEGELQQPTPHRMTYTEDQVNAFLQASLRNAKADKAGTVATKFERAYVHFDDGIYHATLQQSVLGLSLYATTVRTFSIRNGVVTSQPVSGSLGRLPIHPKVLPAFEVVFSQLRQAMEQPLKLLKQMQAVTLQKSKIELITNPSKR